jgi:hypothetical protein
VQDDDLRSACFAALDVICAKHGPDVPYAGGLNLGFAFRGTRVPFLNYQKGIYRSAAQQGPAALSVNTSYRSPYEDEATAEEDGPMLDVLKEAHGAEIVVPKRREWRPDRELLAVRYARFEATG